MSEEQMRAKFDEFLCEEAPRDYDASNADAWHIWQAAWSCRATSGAASGDVAALQRMRAAFHVNMLRAHPDKSHAEIAAEIDRATQTAAATPPDAQIDAEEDSALIQQLGNLLAGVAIALKGPEPALTRWSYHDLPEIAAKTMIELEIYRQTRAVLPQADDLAAPNLKTIGEALDIALHLAREEAAMVHETYKGYKPAKHAHAEKEVLVIEQAIGDLARLARADERDAARYRWLRDSQFNGLYLDRNSETSTNYVTAKQWIEEFEPDAFGMCEDDIIQDMKDANTIWSVQIYPDTPIGSYTWYGASLDVAIDAAIAAMQPKEPS